MPGGAGTGQEANSIPGIFPPSSLSLIPGRTRHDSSTRFDINFFAEYFFFKRVNFLFFLWSSVARVLAI